MVNMSNPVQSLMGVTTTDIREAISLVAALEVAKIVVAALTLELPTTAATLEHEPALFMYL
jgi:hypothetical protein